MRQSNPNLDLVEAAVDLLGPLANELVFIGGCATGLLLTDSAAPAVRATRDVDTLVETVSLGAYYAFCERLRASRFREDQTDGAPICRWTRDGVLIDVMATDVEELNFGNKWLAPAAVGATRFQLPSGAVIRLISAPYFLATKLTAFESRGRGDYVMSHDLEDVISVIDGRPELVAEVATAEEAARQFIVAKFAELLRDRAFVDALPGHLPGDLASQARLPEILHRMQLLATMPNGAANAASSSNPDSL